MNRAAEALDYRKGDNVSGYEDFGTARAPSALIPRDRKLRVERANTRSLIPVLLRVPGDDLASFEAHRLGFFQDLQPLVVLDFAKQCLRHPDLS